MNCPACGKDNSESDQFCRECGTSLRMPTNSNVEATQDTSTRYHGLDALRGIAMLLGIVLHAALPYMPNVEAWWPVDDRVSPLISTIFEFIHIWRMPVFFILAGFFANLLISRRSWKSWWGNRLLRIGLPILVFWPIMSLTLPWIFVYGRTGDITFFYSDAGQPHHLWFLWQLLIFTIVTVLCTPFHLLGIGISNLLRSVGLGVISDISHKAKSLSSRLLFRPRFPLVFIILACVINFPTGGELILNPIGSGLYFAVGYSLYRNTSLFLFLKSYWRYYFLAGIVGFTLYTILNVVSMNLTTNIYTTDTARALGAEDKTTELLALSRYMLKMLCSVLFAYAFIGLAESRFGSYNAKLRFISDGAYWMYLIHLPLVAFISFSMLNLAIPIEMKFIIAIVTTSIICLVTYKYFVRSTIIGILLNGRRYPFKATRT
jgi:glucan biosynthesis protein C